MTRLIDTTNRAIPREIDLRDGMQIVVGRDKSCDVSIASDTVSRRHATIEIAEGRLVVRDGGSRNGTSLDGKPITRAEWMPNQILEIGPARFVFEQSLGEQPTLVKRPSNKDSRTANPTVELSANPTVERSANSARASAPAGNFWQKHWRGDYGLVRSYLVNILLIGALYLFALFFITGSFSEGLAPHELQILLAANTIITLVIGVWQIVGIVRSLIKSKSRGVPLGFRILGWVLVAVPVAAAAIALLAWLGFWLRTTEPETANGGPVYTLAQRNNTLDFRGNVVWPIIRDFRSRLQANPQVNTLMLRSRGGDVIAARRVNDLLRARNITTVVTEFCHSACTIIYAAGKRRLASPRAQIGFHATSIIRMDEMMTRIMNALTFRNDRQNANYYLAAGFDADFVRRAVTTPSTDLLLLPPSELRQLGVVTDIVRR